MDPRDTAIDKHQCCRISYTRGHTRLDWFDLGWEHLRSMRRQFFCFTECRITIKSLTFAAMPKSICSHSESDFCRAHQARSSGWYRRAYFSWQSGSHREDEAVICQSRISPLIIPNGPLQASKAIFYLALSWSSDIPWALDWTHWERDTIRRKRIVFMI